MTNTEIDVDNLNIQPALSQAGLDIQTVLQLKKQFEEQTENSVSNDAKELVHSTLSQIDKRYGNTVNVSMESVSTVVSKIKEYARKIIQAIIEMIHRLLSSFHRFRLKGDAIISLVDRTESVLRGHVANQRRGLFVEAGSLATTLFVSKGGGNPKESYRKLIDTSVQCYEAMDYPALEDILKQLQNASDAEVGNITKQLLVTLSTPLKKILNAPVPEVLKDRNTRSNSDLLCAGPFLGEKYVYAYCPRDSDSISEFHIGMFRNNEAIILKTRLPALGTQDIWDICQKARAFANLLVGFTSKLDIDLRRISNAAKHLSDNTESMKAIAVAAVYPTALNGLHYTAVNMGIETTFAMLDYCQRSIKAQVAVEK